MVRPPEAEPVSAESTLVATASPTSGPPPTPSTQSRTISNAGCEATTAPNPTRLATLITGSADGLSTPEKVDERKPLLPPGTEFVEIPGAIHSFFGDYGLQPGDGTPTVSREAAQQQIVALTVALLERISDPSA